MPAKTISIHFICRGNVLRSLIAETYVRSLGLDGIATRSSGTNVDQEDPTERQYFMNTCKVLERHDILSFAKQRSDQLTKDRFDANDITVFLNSRVREEAKGLVHLTGSEIVWDIVDIGEGHRTNRAERENYEEAIYNEITNKVDELISSL